MPDQLNGTVPQGTFGVSKGDQDPSGPAPYPISTPMGVVSPPNINVSGGSSSGGSSGGSSVGSKVLGGIGTVGGSIIGGPIGGAIGGVLGDVIGGLFAQGGPVTHGNPVNEFAEGGEVKQQNSPQDALTMGYLVGAHHQKNYGGTPKTLTQAANDIKEMLALSAKSRIEQLGHSTNAYDPPLGEERNPDSKGAELENYAHQHGYDNKDAPLPKGYASGGSTQAAAPTATASTPQQSFNSYDDLAQYYGENTGDTSSLGGDSSPTATPQPQQSSMPVSAPTTNTLYPTASTQGTTAQTDQTSINPDITRGSYKYASQGGYMNYADGGPQMPLQGQSQPSLQVGQAFQGDGSVKGPGGPQDDAIPAKLSNGEFVMSQPAVQFFGVDKLNQMNEKGKQGFMQMMQQVQGNQGQPQEGAPGAGAQMVPPNAGMMQRPPPQGAMKDGGSVLRTKGSGYCGL